MKLFFLVTAFLVSISGELPDDKCATAARAARGILPFPYQLREHFQGTEIKGRDGTTYRLQANVKGNSLTLSLEDSQKQEKGEFALTSSDDGKVLFLDSAFVELRGQGLISSLLRRVYELAPKGAKLSLDSKNEESNHAMHVIRNRISRRQEYRILLDAPEQANSYLQRQLTATVRRLYETDPDQAPVWYRALASGAWQNIRVRTSGRYDDQYTFSAEKPAD